MNNTKTIAIFLKQGRPDKKNDFYNAYFAKVTHWHQCI